jgi:anion-transporting  ArsA/GET3 family ATPase
VTAEKLLEGRRVCVCAGSGGVGKTTLAAALALGMAARGGRVAVVTIDPARRLASSLGLSAPGHEHRVEPESLRSAGLDVPGELWAMTLDPKGTWDELVRRHAPDAAAAERVLGNRVYAELSTAVAGSQEYMAAEKLWQLHESGRYDLVVLDTPPTRNALEFLDAPRRLSRFVDSPAVGVLLAPSRAGLKLLERGGGLVLGLIERVTGADLLRDLVDFLAAFGDLAQRLQDRAERVEELLGSAETTFVVVAAPERDPVDEAIFFRRRLRRGGMPFGAAVVNRVRPDPAPGLSSDEAERALAGALGPATARVVAECLEDHRRLTERDRREIARLEEELAGEPLLLVPQLPDAVIDLAGLARIGEHLFAPTPRAAAATAGS